jgi:hypothetical protein
MYPNVFNIDTAQTHQQTKGLKMIKVPVRTVRVKVLHKNQQLGSSSLAALALSHKPMKACIFHDFICQVK